MDTSLHPAVLNLLAAGLALGVGVTALAARPALGLRGALFAFAVGLFACFAGDALRLLAPGPPTQAVARALFHIGGLPTGAAAWVFALRYAQLQGRMFTGLGRSWLWLPPALAAAGWLVIAADPWHGAALEPGAGRLALRQPLGLALAGIGLALVGGAVTLFAALARGSSDASVRRYALAMAAGVGLALACGLLDALAPGRLPGGLAVLLLCATLVLFAIASYRTRLLQLLPVAVREVVRHSRDGTLVATPSGRVVYVNPAGAEMLGLAADAEAPSLHALLEQRLRDPEGAPLDARALLARLLAKPHAAGDSVLRSADGTRWLRLHSTSIPGRGSEPAALSLQLTDVSEEQRALRALERGRDELERRIAERTAALRQSEERYRHVSELSSDTAFGCRLRPSGAVEMIWLSREVKLLFKTGVIEPVDVLGWSRVVHPEDRERVIGAARALALGSPCDLEFRITAASGDERWLELHARVLEREADGSLQVVGALRDVSDRKRAEQDRLDLELRVQEAQRLESLGGLAGGIAHDFNNLLSIVLGNATLGHQELPPGHPARARLERIRAAGEYATQLTEQMLTYAGRARPKLAALDLSRVIEEMIDLLEASARPCRLVTDLAQGLPPISGDETQIRQVVMNLVSNAQQASQASKAPIYVRTGRMRAGRGWLSEAVGATLPEGDLVYVEVQDAGSGMDAATRARVFEPFYSTRTAGRGLGLAVVLGIVRAHHGAIHLDTAPGRGSAFRVVLPPSQRRPIAPAPVAPAAASGGEVLIVDDDPGVRELSAEFLTRAGFRAHLAASAAEAAALIAEHGAGLAAAVVDLKLPDGDARTVLRSLEEQGLRVPVIVATGHSEDVATNLLGERRPAGFLRKPWTPEALLAALRDAIGPARGERAADEPA